MTLKVFFTMGNQQGNLQQPPDGPIWVDSTISTVAA